MVNQHNQQIDEVPFITFREQNLSHHPFSSELSVVKSLEAWYAKFEFIQHLTLFNNVLIVLLGEKGCGKTTFLEHFSTKIDDSLRLSQLNSSSVDSVQKIIETGVADFNLKATVSIDDMVTQINQRKKHCLLILDDAGDIEAAIINELLRAIKAQGIHGFFHVMIASDYSILEYLGSNLEVDNEGLIHTIELAELSANEIKRYIMTCLTEAGYQGDFPLTIPQFDQLIKVCGGNISNVNRYMADFIANDGKSIEKTLNFSPDKKGVLTRVMRISASALPLLVVSVIIYYVMPSFQGEQQITTVTLPKPRPQVFAKPQSHFAKSNHRTDENESNGQLSENEDRLLSQKASTYTTKQFAHERSVVMDKVIVAPKTTHEIKKSQITTIDFQPVLVSSLGKIPQLPELKSHKYTPKLDVVKHKPIKKPVTIAKKQTKTSSSKRQVIPSNHFTIQLVASKNLSAIKRYAQSHGINKQSHYYKVSSKGQTWFVLGYGNYKDKTMARQSMARLPKELVKNKPWIRDSKQLKQIV